MILVRVSDNRCMNKYRVEYFEVNEINEEVICFVKKNKRVYNILSSDGIYSREEFLEKYDV